MEPSVNFQNVAGFETAATSSHHKSLECFLVKGSRNDLSSLVSGTSISFLYPCPAPLDLKQNIPFCPSLFTFKFSCAQHLSELHLQ